MHRRLLALGVPAALVALVAGCGIVNDAGREDFGFKGTAHGVPFELTVKTGPVEDANDTRRLKDAAGNQSMQLGESNPECASEANHDEVYELTIKADVEGTETLDLAIIMEVADAVGNGMTPKTNGDVRIAWLTETRATCQRTSNGTFAEMALSKEEDYQVKGLLVLPGGVDNYNGFTLSVGTDAGEINSLKGGVEPYSGNIGVTTALVP